MWVNHVHYGYYISLYCHSNGEGLWAPKHLFNQRTFKEPSSETLLRLAELALTLNYFSFGGNLTTNKLMA